jgi:quercetin dioxygenase-like cupin family protein
VHTFDPDTELPEHMHEEVSVHVILKGEMTLIEKDGDKVLKAGDWYEMPKGTTHQVRVGSDGCIFVVGVKK